ncbi:uroporphyrin-III C-methyltransferase/precorrin-2 dehydrogenase/sirohydrochlorin ferrochelatase [Rhizobium sp. BK650]|uniref:siroheme synthase CysG n=1 Tax=Rhizobium sp. BK650 TaxID=2586990 RepID=UPI00160F5A87|nr:siroheme synthase CysG [Rhizobium sp. BK650]MBB3657770.1 uroporphyrin-III C-methyltransferase/precorrin-2 dehydrogenase/sirohydrochlorin ferrochelatase [Rhizobium sp. BK650]
MPVLQTLPNEVAARASARMAPLAKLPIFWSLAGQRVVVAGGSDACAWKAELFAACGAKVEIHAEMLGEACATLIERGSPHPEGGLAHHPVAWREDILAGAALAVADCEDEAEARTFFEAAGRAGVPVNVIDKPAFCQFQFGSIVNRSPVVVSISTDGAAPILAQAIRRRIETLLPTSLKAWASLAQSLREEIALRLKPGAERRAFWERFVDRAFAAEPTEANKRDLLANMEKPTQARDVGRVTLVGAGPGDAEYLTLKAVRALQAADVILFDDLVSDEVLELARREAKRLLVGKRGGRESCRQEDINEMMLTFAKAGKNVARLKSGDPMIFGRAGEEIAYLKQHDIPVDVVPGITAASAMASRLGISLTHRDHAQTVQFVTGHSRHGELPETVDWQALADRNKTTVFYMGGRTAGGIQTRLIAAGLAAETPVVIVSSVANADERRWSGNLEDLATAMTDIGFDRPVLIGVGDVFAACRLMMESNLRAAVSA